MKAKVDQDLCISCGACIDICPEVFDWNDDGKASAIEGDVPEEHEAHVDEAIDACPVEAISKE
ncbi:ferredoxin [Desulfuribacillus alkaliarsenatis]|uniref:Ferredoxin n=1 Tax=Desulfuribacillus alkaliarsenatis TaxID=766136 RepID=A0A1E5FZ22_9FIRM|nr:ferredoxin [Desulfuribacillus alkaliarsenatis]OEF95825.1 ferredoxin [Desulfuribacillus alkaliarsenatis]